MSSRLEAVTRGSSWRTAPAAALRGLANSGSPWSARRVVSRSEAPFDLYTPPRPPNGRPLILGPPPQPNAPAPRQPDGPPVPRLQLAEVEGVGQRQQRLAV